MAIPALPLKFSSVQREFSGTNKMSAYVRGGSFVATTDYGVSNVSTTVNGLKLSQFANSQNIYAIDFTGSVYTDMTPIGEPAALNPTNVLAYDSVYATFYGQRVVVDPGPPIVYGPGGNYLTISNFSSSAGSAYTGFINTFLNMSNVTLISTSFMVAGYKQTGVTANTDLYYNSNTLSIVMYPTALTTSLTIQSTGSATITKAQLIAGSPASPTINVQTLGSSAGAQTASIDSAFIRLTIRDTTAR